MNHRSGIKTVKVFCVKHCFFSFVAGMSILLFFLDDTLGQQSSKSRQASGNSTSAIVSSASASRTADLRADPKPKASSIDASGLLTFERINELTGFVPASDAEVRAFVAMIQAAVTAKDAIALKGCFSVELLMARSIVAAEMSSKQRSEFIRGGQATSSFSLLADQAMKSNSDLQLLRFNRCGTHLRPLFRFVVANEGLVYNEFVIQTVDGQGPKIVDVLALRCPDYVSICKRPFAVGPFLSKRCPERISSTGIESSIVDSAEEFADFAIQVARHDANGTLASLDNIRPPLDEHPGILATKCEVSRSIDLSAYRKAVVQLAETYPETVASNLMLLDLYRRKKSPVEMLAMADLLMTALEDPWLNAYRIEGLITQNRIKEAKEAITAAKTAAPNISDPYVAELGMLMKLKNHQETAQAIETLETKFGDKVVKLTEFPEFNEFSDSEVGRHFLAKRAGFDF